MNHLNILAIWKKKILFGYYYYPAYEYPEMTDAGFSVRLFANGRLICQTYSLNRHKEPVTKQSCSADLSENTVGKISRILAGYAKEIDALPEMTSNGSCEGAFNDFAFCGQYVSCINITRTDPEKVRRTDPRHYRMYQFDMADENTVLDIFTRICEAMRSDGVRLYLRHLYLADEAFY